MWLTYFCVTRWRSVNKVSVNSRGQHCDSTYTRISIRGPCANGTFSALIKIGYFLSRVTLKFERWSWKTTGHLFSATSRSVHHFVSHQLIQTRVTVRKRTIWVTGENRRIFVPYDLDTWRMAVKNNRTPLLCHFKLCASFHSHRWIQTRVTVRKRQIWVKIGDFFVLCDLEFWRMTSKNNRAPLLCHCIFVHHFIAMCEFKLELRSENAQTGAKFVLTSVTLTFDLGLLHGHPFCQW